MSGLLDFGAVLSGQPLEWLAAGFTITLAVSVVGLAVAVLIGVLLFGLRLAPSKGVGFGAAAVIGLFRNTPLLVQLLFWYFAGYGVLPVSLRDWLIGDHPWATLPGGVSLLAPEFLTTAWGLGLFFGVFMAEELRAGVAAVSPGQVEAGRSQGFSSRDLFVKIQLPQALGNAWQPLVGQALNLMKFSSLASAIGLAELTYQVRQIESLNARGFESMAAGTLLYLALGLVLGRVLTAAAPGRRTWRKTAGARHGA